MTSHQARLGIPTPRDLWQKVEDSGGGVSVFCIVLFHGLKPYGKLPCVIILFPYGKCQDKSCSIRICSPWPLPAWLSNHVGFPSCLGLLFLGPACLTQLIALKPALFFFFFFFITFLSWMFYITIIVFSS